MSPHLESRTRRLGPLSGVIAGVLAIGAFAASAGAAAPDASGKDVLAFFTAHQARQQTSDVLWSLAYVALVFFAGQLVARLRNGGLLEPLRTATQAGVAILAGAGTLFFGLDYVLAAMPHGVDPAAAQTVNVSSQQLFLPVIAGMLTFGLAVGAGIITTRALPVWLGWVAIVISVLSVSPFAIFAVFGIFVWALAAGIVMLRSARVLVMSPAG